MKVSPDYFNNDDICNIYFALNELVKRLNDFPYARMSESDKKKIVAARDKAYDLYIKTTIMSEE